jgi:hypothetical protein
MDFAEFYHMSTGCVPYSIPPRYEDNMKKPIPACGDRSIIILDGRNNRATHVHIAREECRKRGYVGFTLNSGRTFCDSHEVRPLELIQ